MFGTFQRLTLIPPEGKSIKEGILDQADPVDSQK